MKSSSCCQLCFCSVANCRKCSVIFVTCLRFFHKLLSLFIDLNVLDRMHSVWSRPLTGIRIVSRNLIIAVPSLQMHHPHHHSAVSTTAKLLLGLFSLHSNQRSRTKTRKQGLYIKIDDPWRFISLPISNHSFDFQTQLIIHSLWYVLLPITVAARSKAWIICARSNAGIMGSNPIQSIDICMHLFCVCVVLCVDSGFMMGWSPIQGVLLTVYRIEKLWSTTSSIRYLKSTPHLSQHQSHHNWKAR
jgi:hypothetical protein